MPNSSPSARHIESPVPGAPEPLLTSLSHGGGCGCKMAPELLADILRGSGARTLPSELLVGFDTADDAAVYRLGEDQALIATTDFFMPIVDDPEDFGRIAATNAISDVYAMGGRPIMALAVVAMPVGVLSTRTIAMILKGGEAVCDSIGIPIAGGHSIDSAEVIYGLIVLGLADPKHIKRNADAQPGDLLVLGKPLGVGIMSAALKRGELGDSSYARMIETTTKLNTAGPELAVLVGVHAMTDVTGFGLAGHCLEMARGAGCGIRIEWAAVPMMEGVRSLASRQFVTGASKRNWAAYGSDISLPERFAPEDLALLTDPQTSGGLLVSCAPADVDQVLGVFRGHGFTQAGVIGIVGDASDTPRLVVA